MKEKRLKIFISAYACEPGKGSEPGIGWNVVNELSKYHEIHVLTRANNREPVEKGLEITGTSPVFHYYDLPKWLSFWKKKKRGYRFYYYLWQYGAFLKYRKFINTNSFDLVEHLTFANFAIPSLFMLCKPVTVYGPIGTTPIPPAIFRALPLKVKIRELLRKWSMNFLIHLEPFRFLTSECADWIIECGRVSGKSCFPNRFRDKIRLHPQTGINTEEPEYRCVRRRKEDGKIRLLICSEFLHWKGVTFSCETFARIARKRDDVELIIYGGGPEKSAMKKILADAGVSDRAQFIGFVSKAEMIQALFDADILLYPSYHHGLATIILQAMYARLPIVALKGDPVGEAVEEGAGITVSGNSMAAILDHLELETERLIESAKLREQMGTRGRELIESQYEWRVLTENLSDILAGLAALPIPGKGRRAIAEIPRKPE